jgi:hypothetical protein
MKYIIPILLIILIISLFFENVFIEPLNSCQLADFPEVYGGDINYVSKSDQKTIIIRDFDREDYYKEDEEYIKLVKSKKTTSYAPLDRVSTTTTKIPVQLSTSNVPMTTKTPSNYSTTSITPTVVRNEFTSTPSSSSTPTMQYTPSSSSTSNTPIR